MRQFLFAALAVITPSMARNLPRNLLARTCTWTRKFSRDAIQRVPSSDKPPPGTIMCTCG